MGNHEHNHEHGEGCCGGHHHHHEAHDHHHHDHGDDCGCGHDHGSSKIYLTMDGGEQVECDVLDVFSVKDKEYIAVLPEGEEDVFIYQFEDDEEYPRLSLIENEDEFALVSQAFLEKFEALEE